MLQMYIFAEKHIFFMTLWLLFNLFFSKFLKKLSIFYAFIFKRGLHNLMRNIIKYFKLVLLYIKFLCISQFTSKFHDSQIL